ncbi:MAG: ribonuclease HI [Lachnospiraceae bacterium]|nr:ribonuclease HI [Lachnospiraceae bacterium]
MNKAIIYTDGSCHGNPGPGGYAAIVTQDGITKEVHGADWYTTNNRMELMAVIEGLKLLGKPSAVEIVTDSKYVANQINKGNLKSFIQDPNRKNADLWQVIYRQSVKHALSATWVRGHSGHKQNQRCDSLANMEATRLENEKEIRIFTVSELLKDVTTTPEQIAARFRSGYPLDLVQKYYNQFFYKMSGVGGVPDGE